jgi:peptidoglycan/LPS O-acetylase OafA/YrhL
LGAVSTQVSEVSSASAAAGNGLARAYRPELDAVRFLAFLLVFIHHSFPAINVPLHADFAAANQIALRARLSFEELFAAGLCLFFTLSAYLITDLLLREREVNGAISVKKFYIRRALRIWPLYFFGVGLGAAIALLTHRTNDLVGFGWYLLLAGNIYCGIFGWPLNPMTPLWSISIEEQFYLIWPWTIRLFSKRGLIACAVFFLVVANITLFVLGQRHAETQGVVWTNTLVQFEMFATGILLALAKRRETGRNPLAGLSLVLTAPFLWFVACFVFRAHQPAEAGTAISGPSLMIGFALIALGCAAVLQGFCMIGPLAIPRWVAYLGKISYGLYVYHGLSIDVVRGVLGTRGGILNYAVTVVLAFLLAVTASVISYNFLEAPFLRLKRRFEIVHGRPA